MNMTREDVIRIALEVGFYDGEVDKCQLMLERFAYLVAQQEREACAKIADEFVGQDLENNFSALIAHNIRAKGQA